MWKITPELVKAITELFKAVWKAVESRTGLAVLVALALTCMANLVVQPYLQKISENSDRTTEAVEKLVEATEKQEDTVVMRISEKIAEICDVKKGGVQHYD